MVRLKHRYLLVNILYPNHNPAALKYQPGPDIPYGVQFRAPSSDKLDARLLLRMIRDGVAELFGDYGSGKVAPSLQIKYLSTATSTAIIRVSRDHYRLVWTALTLITKLPQPVDSSCAMQVVRVSGTIKKAEEEAIRRARRTIVRTRRATPSGGAPHSSIAFGADGDDDDANADNDDGMANGIEDLDDGEAIDEEDDDD